MKFGDDGAPVTLEDFRDYIDQVSLLDTEGQVEALRSEMNRRDPRAPIRTRQAFIDARTSYLNREERY